MAANLTRFACAADVTPAARDFKPEFLISYVYAGQSYTVVLLSGRTSQPAIRVYDDSTAQLTNDARLTTMLEHAAMAGGDFIQLHGDGPELDIIPASAVATIIGAALKAISPTRGRFECVWVPNDPSLPF